MNTLKIYGPKFSYFVRSVRLMCQYKQLSYETTLAPFEKKILPFSDEHKRLHPFKKMPILIDGDLIIPETIAIARYLDTRSLNTPQLNKSTDKFSLFFGTAFEQAQTQALADMISQYVHYAIMKNLCLEFAFPKGPEGSIRINNINDELPKAHDSLKWLCTIIKDSHYCIHDQFSICDTYLIPMLDYLSRLPSPYNIISEYPVLERYIHFHQIQTYSEGVLGKPDMSN